MTISNGSFETQATGGPTGAADAWTASEVFTAEAYAEFAGDPSDVDTSGQETFDAGWYPPLDQVFEADFSAGYFTDIDPAFFDGGTKTFEEFEHLWGTTLFASSGLQVASFDVGAAAGSQGFEDFEDSWPVLDDVFIPAFGIFGIPGSAITFAQFDAGVPGGFEDFEEEWGSFDLTLPGAVLVFFTEALSLIQAERFEVVRFDLESVTVNPSTDLVLKTAHSLILGEPVTFRNESGRLPDGLQSSTQYLVFNVNANDLQVRATAPGSAIDIVDSGFGAHFIVHSPARYWIEELEGV